MQHLNLITTLVLSSQESIFTIFTRKYILNIIETLLIFTGDINTEKLLYSSLNIV